MSGMGVAMMGTAMAEGSMRATDAANRAISSPLLEDASVEGARGVIINVTGGPDMSLMEVNEALTIIHEAAHEDANIIFGAVVDPQLAGKVKITVIATGFDHLRPERMAPGALGTPTPVDMNAYTSYRPAVVAGGDLSPNRMTISRRPSIEVPSAGRSLPTAVGQNSTPRPAGAGADADGDTELDVPAFLRRSDG
jgi:cell division protein FtsZ